jgi:hypothetical protein
MLLTVRLCWVYLQVAGIDSVGGVYLVIAGDNIAMQVKKSSNSRVKRIMLGYSIVMLVIVSTWFGLVAVTNEKTDVEGLLNPSSRSASTSCSGLGIAREAFGTIMIWAADTLLVNASKTFINEATDVELVGHSFGDYTSYGTTAWPLVLSRA